MAGRIGSGHRKFARGRLRSAETLTESPTQSGSKYLESDPHVGDGGAALTFRRDDVWKSVHVTSVCLDGSIMLVRAVVWLDSPVMIR